MNVRAEWEPGTTHYSVWVWTNTYATRRVATGIDENGRLIWKDVADHAKVEPLLRVEAQFLDGLRKALNQIGPLTQDSTDWLRDAIAQRDRMTALVEKVVEGAVTPLVRRDPS